MLKGKEEEEKISRWGNSDYKFLKRESSLEMSLLDEVQNPFEILEKLHKKMSISLDF